MTRKNRARIRKSTKRTGRKNTRKYRGGFFNLLHWFKPKIDIESLKKQQTKCWRSFDRNCSTKLQEQINIYTKHNTQDKNNPLKIITADTLNPVTNDHLNILNNNIQVNKDTPKLSEAQINVLLEKKPLQERLKEYNATLEIYTKEGSIFTQEAIEELKQNIKNTESEINKLMIDYKSLKGGKSRKIRRNKNRKQ